MFDGPDAYRSAFEGGLRRMLDEPSLGAFILALANASFEPGLYRQLSPRLASAYARWCGRFDAADAEAVGAAPDDRAVFERLRATGFDALGTTQWRRAGPWVLQFNPLRGFRPPRMSHVAVDRLYRDFDPAGFHFDKPFLRPEVLWEGDCGGRMLRLLLNKFPFAEGHGLMVPDPAHGRPQWLTADDHAWLWALFERVGTCLPGIGAGYNARGAYASINHLHFQLFVSDARYPVESATWRHRGGPRDYPLPVEHFDTPDDAWEQVDGLQRADRAFNLLYRPGEVYVVERRLQGSYAHSDWTGGFAWSEVAGGITLSDGGAFGALDAAAIEAEFAQMRPSG
jgi:hypothetical protein